MSDDYGILSPVETPAPDFTPDPVVEAAVRTPSSEDAPVEPPSEFDETERDERGKFKKRSRAHSQQATPADVPIIQELTKANREGRERLEQLAKTGSPRVQKLAREQIDIQTQLEQPVAPAVVLPVLDPPPPPSIPWSEPTIGEFANHDDPYGAWQRALAKYDRQQEAREAQEAAQLQQAQQQAVAAQAYWNGVKNTHMSRLAAAMQSDPRNVEILQSVQIEPPPLLNASIMLDNDSATVALFLASRPYLLDELILWTDKKQVTQQNVDIIRRRLQQMMTAGTTGAVVSSPPPLKVPRPPTPVRTGPMQTGETPPSDDDSLEAHASRYGHIRLDQRGKRRG